MKIKRKSFWGGLVATLCACATVITGLSLSGTNGRTVANAATGSAPASILSLNGEFASKLQGAQKESVFIGTNVSSTTAGEAGYGNTMHTGTIKWRVLSTNDTKYSSGNMLLWADYQLGTNKYNSENEYTNQNYGFWSTSRMRATLNGGDYPVNDVAPNNMPSLSGNVADGNSYYGKIFNSNEKDTVVKADLYKTDDCGYDSGSPLYKRDNITVNDYGVNGKYNQTILGKGTARDARKTSAGDLTAAGDGSTTVAGGGVQETTSGDKLFLLDYYDINNLSYGFGDSGLTYAKKVNSTWTPSSNWFPGYYDNNNNGSTKVNYLSFSGDLSSYYWLRTAMRNTTNTGALYVDLSGYVWHHGVCQTYGVRPAFNFNASSVVYATASANRSSFSTTFTDVSKYTTSKPEYKLYFKASDYNTDKAIAAYDSSSVKVAYKTPSNFTSGNAMLLLSNADGSVAYQAATSISSSTTTQVTTFNLPTNVNYGDYSATLLFTSKNGGEKSETVYATYSLDGTIDAPGDISGLTYDGGNKWIDKLGTMPSDWKDLYWDLKVYNDVSFMTPTVQFTDTLGNVATTVGTADVIKAGTYSVTMTLSNGLKWSTGDTDDKSFNISIGKATPTVTATFPSERPFVSNGFPQPTSYTATCNGNSITGTFEFINQTDLIEANKSKSYEWTFTPDAEFINDISSVKDYVTLNFQRKQILSKTYTWDPTVTTIYTKTSVDDLMNMISLEVVYNNDPTNPVNETNFNIEAAHLVAGTGNSYLMISFGDGAPERFNIPSTVNVIEAAVDSLTVMFNQKTDVITVETPLNDLKQYITLWVKWNYNSDQIKVDDSTAYSLSGTLGVNGSNVVLTYEGIPETVTNIIVSKANYNIDDTLFTDKTVGFTGTAFNPEGWIDTNKLPAGMTVTYSCSTDMTTVGDHTVTASFSNPDSANYNDPAAKTAKLTISALPVYDMTGVVLGGTAGVSGDRASGFTSTYDGNGFEITADTATLPSGVSVDNIVYEKKQSDGTWGAVVGKPSGAGEYRVTVNFKGASDHAAPDCIITTLTVEKADIDVPDSLFTEKSITYTGDKFDPAGWIDISALPTGVTVTYTCPTDMTTIGEHVVTAKFTNPDPDNYNDIADKTAKLIISNKVVVSVSAKVEDGATFTANSTLDDLKAKLLAEVEYNNGTKEAVAVDNLTLTCDTLREGGKFEVGTQTVTITYNDGTKDFTTTVEIVVAKAKVALPVYNGTLSYTGLELKPTANDFDGYNADIMTFNESKTIAGLNAGAYKAVFALKDGDRYEWATTTSLKKSVFAAAVYDGETEITLGANEAAVDWNIAKAKISAVTGEDGKPVFKSEGVSAAILAQAVGLKYYKDEACTQGIAADELDYETTYYLQADLLDSANFAFENSVAEVVSVPYTTPAKELTFWEKVVKFMTSKQMGLVVWLWIVIALVALILLITIIALAAKSRKKKRIREEQRLAEEKAERLAREERDREERRLEREERMARMSQQQSMPQMMMPQMMPQMPMQQPQYAPQSQPMAMGGGASSNEIAELKAEITALRAEQSLRDISELKAEQQVTQTKIDLQLANILSRLGGEQIVQGGISMDKLTEIIRTEVNNALDGREKAAQSANATTDVGAAPATPQVPPDAVMTTVTTTKIDTTKKSAQGTHDTAQAARPTRSFVPPMPVDDGRVFDVGGFYKPADPATDFNFDEEDKKD